MSGGAHRSSVGYGWCSPLDWAGTKPMSTDVNNGVLAIHHLDNGAFGGDTVVGARHDHGVGVRCLIADVGGRVVQRRADLDPDEVVGARKSTVGSELGVRRGRR